MKLYYEHGGIQIWHGDCREVLPLLASASVDLVLTDPPYGITQLDWDVPVDWVALWPMLYRICKPTALQVVCSAQPFTTDLINSNRRRFRYDLVWPKTMPTGFLNASRRPLRAHETLIVFAERFGGNTYNPQKIPCKPEREHVAAVRSKPHKHYGCSPTQFNGIVTERHPTSVLPAFSNGHGGVSEHETAKPLDLMVWLVATYSNPGDLVLDPFGGSGTTARACKDLGRRCILIEQEERYAEIAARRLQQEVLFTEPAL